MRQATCRQGIEFFRKFTNSDSSEVVLRFCGRLDWQLFDQAGVAVSEDPDGRRYIDDPDDMRLAMATWIGRVYKRGGAPVGLRNFYAAVGGTPPLDLKL